MAIFGHGFGNDRHFVPMMVAGTMARFGYATVAINVVGHGGGPEGTLTVLRTGQDPVTLPAGGRGMDLDGDGRIGATEGVGTRAGTPLALIGSRDGLRQTTADLMQLVRAICRGVDVDGDGSVDLDRERMVYFGQSFGGIYGTLLMAVDPLVRVGVLNVAGGPIVEIARQSPVFRGLVVDQLKRRQPPLMNGEQDFTESIPLPGEAPVREPAAGALDIQAYFDRAEWLSQPANPVAFAPYLKQAPLLGVGVKAVLYQWAVGDRTVPNPTTAALLRAGVLQPVSSLYRHDPAGVSERFKNPHGFLVWTAFPEVYAIGRAAKSRSRASRLRRPADRARLPQFEIGAPRGPDRGRGSPRTGSPPPNPKRRGPSTLLSLGAERFLVDAGSGVGVQLVQAGVRPYDWPRVFITHHHSDHVIDLGHLLITRWIVGQNAPLEIWGPAGTKRQMDKLLDYLHWDVEVRRSHMVDRKPPAVTVTEIEEGQIMQAGGVTVSAFLVEHDPVKPAFGSLRRRRPQRGHLG